MISKLHVTIIMTVIILIIDIIVISAELIVTVLQTLTLWSIYDNHSIDDNVVLPIL